MLPKTWCQSIETMENKMFTLKRVKFLENTHQHRFYSAKYDQQLLDVDPSVLQVLVDRLP